MSYVVDATNAASPTNDQGATQGAEELRALKAYIATLAGLGSGLNLFRKNAIIGGDFATNPWNRGTSFAAVASDAYTADRWQYSKSGTMVHTIRRGTGPGNIGIGYSPYCLEAEVTTADAAITAADYCILGQKVEGLNYLGLAFVPKVLSFWHKHSKAGIYCVGFRNSGADRFFTKEYTQQVANAWEFSYIPIPAEDGAGVWDYSTGIGLRVEFVIAAGTNYQGAAGAWAAGGAAATANQVNGTDTIGNMFRIANVQLEKGSIYSPFEFLPASIVEQLCERYLPIRKIDAGGHTFVGQAISGVVGLIPVAFRVRARVTPVGVSIFGGGAYYLTSSTGVLLAGTGISLGDQSPDAARVDVQVAAGLVAGNSTLLIIAANSGLLFTGCEL